MMALTSGLFPFLRKSTLARCFVSSHTPDSRSWQLVHSLLPSNLPWNFSLDTGVVDAVVCTLIQITLSSIVFVNLIQSSLSGFVFGSLIQSSLGGFVFGNLIQSGLGGFVFGSLVLRDPVLGGLMSFVGGRTSVGKCGKS